MARDLLCYLEDICIRNSLACYLYLDGPHLILRSITVSVGIQIKLTLSAPRVSICFVMMTTGHLTLLNN